MSIDFLHSIRLQLAILLLGLVAVVVASSGYAVHSAQMRQQEQVVLATAARLEHASHLMREQAMNYLATPARDYSTYFRDVKLYYQDLLAHRETLDQNLGPDGRLLAARDGLGTADHPAVLQAARVWADFRTGLDGALGDVPEEPRLEWGAEYVIEHAPRLEEATAALHRAFEEAARAGLNWQRRLVRVAVITALLIMLGAVYWLHTRVLRPLHHAVGAFEHVSQGDFGHQVPVPNRNEIGLMVESFNSLSYRLHALFQLIDKVQQAEDPESVLTSVWHELETFIPLDWAALLSVTPDQSAGVLEHAVLDGRSTPPSERYFPLANSQLDAALAAKTPLRIPDLQQTGGGVPMAAFERTLIEQGLRSVLLLPVKGTHQHTGLLVLASRQPNAYLLSHQQLITNLAGLIGHALQKTVAMEKQ
ncbi:integral membrane sensor signal transduction histidine kinase [Thioalkalivibrio nitratireducens DSM 14787]|uniref:Integral membrane sensor signal transduction histidine kinase n=1 Tax=Thioalkalivibrio nitratireducens (strain DSM 14787 / UNIQEM 213 / ALEN2) TaxID=1255043 RepID=L0DWF5_THIND|nr:HAMP domain-containing protein [Thioalkalivibrio nitratireducens]AGA32701.1 integral membrane sensor signal transduction histidine kinase [Thioalkalivibrio nitratireducens DSM 14787]